CPSCKGFLNVGNHVVFSAATKENKRGVVLLSATLGDYSIVHHPTFSLPDGEKVSFYCPICHVRLASRKHTNLARILMVDEKNEVYELLFSEITGERCTVQVMGDKFKVFGEHSSHYREFLEIMRKSHPYKNL
ncbi:MAG: hypothetical protein Q8M23_10325, partial [Bacteroidales bacterium]|nr:hypothetical protein [Bacteroidales bacterium]